MIVPVGILLVLTELLAPTTAQILCPGGGFPFDYQTCDPDVRSQCPSGFTCRSSSNNSTGTKLNLCCESGRMTAKDWFTDKQLTPQILPTPPYGLIETVQLAPASATLNFPPARIGDELVVISSPGYITGIIQSLSVANMINPGYIHVVTVVDPLYKPFAVLLNYNIIVGQPSQTINVTSSQRFQAYLDNTVSMPKQDSYRSLYMVLIYYSASPISLDGTTPQDMILGTCTDAKCLFSTATSPLITKMGQQPMAGTIFYVFSTSSQKISGDVGTENTVDEDAVVTQNPFLINIPTINWDDILKNINIPTLPPFQIPTLDPNFWQNLPTLAPIQIPTLPPFVLPTLDPNFWQNLIPTLPPFQIPTLDPDFWKNLNIPTLPPFQIPTLDPKIFNFPTPTPRTSQCTYKLAQEIQNNSTFEASLNYTNIQSIVDSLLGKSVILCSQFQAQKLTDLSNKYGVLIADFEQVVPYLSTSQLKTILLGILNADSIGVSQIFFSKTMENLANPDVINKLSKVSSQVGLLQLDLAISPV